MRMMQHKKWKSTRLTGLVSSSVLCIYRYFIVFEMLGKSTYVWCSVMQAKFRVGILVESIIILNHHFWHLPSKDGVTLVTNNNRQIHQHLNIFIKRFFASLHINFLVKWTWSYYHVSSFFGSNSRTSQPYSVQKVIHWNAYNQVLQIKKIRRVNFISNFVIFCLCSISYRAF